MFAEQDLQAEINKTIDRQVAANQVAHLHWLIHWVLAKYPGVEGRDIDFYMFCARGHVAYEVRRVLKKRRKLETKDDDQLTLPGWKHLHKEYSIVRNKEPCVVPIERATDDELVAKAEEYNRMIQGLQEHRDEILRYIELRKIEAAG